MDLYLKVCLIMSLLTFLVFGIDKALSKGSGSRVPEITLLTLSSLGGAFGAFCGRLLFKHKTNVSTKAHFAVVIYASLIMQVGFAVLVLWRADGGAV